MFQFNINRFGIAIWNTRNYLIQNSKQAVLKCLFYINLSTSQLGSRLKASQDEPSIGHFLQKVSTKNDTSSSLNGSCNLSSGTVATCDASIFSPNSILSSLSACFVFSIAFLSLISSHCEEHLLNERNLPGGSQLLIVLKISIAIVAFSS